MISHKHKCIFIHIQRTGGTSIEEWICGKDWWGVEKETKHLLASQAKEIYKKYWNSYFKFSIVRNPLDRMVSLTLKHPKHHNLKLSNNKIDVSGYKNKYGYPLTLEYDWRFYKKENILKQNHIQNCVYKNILDEELDYIGYFENYKETINFLKNKLNINKEFNIHKQKTNNRKRYNYYYTPKIIEEIRDLYKEDLKEFNYNI